MVDFDNDGRKDIFTANSHVNDTVGHFSAARYKLRNTVFRNAGDGTFESVSGSGFDAERAYRGAAFADFNADGKVDIVVTALGAGAELFANRTDTPNAWIALRLVGTASNRDGIGAQVRIGRQTNHKDFQRRLRLVELWAGSFWPPRQDGGAGDRDSMAERKGSDFERCRCEPSANGIGALAPQGALPI